ncbi:calcium-binding protein [Paracoccus ravus]|uniref:calcium-binding protein n=1 Tax=Paracoccus ravus TaxID=2447760 RepID=UPI00106E1237|nr:calcium-binding protein [Paracoccus ravus]
MPDTGPSRLLALDTPAVLDLRAGQVQAIFSASVSDPDSIRQVTVYYDRPLATQSGAYAFQIIHGYGDSWTDGSHSYTTQILPHNIGGTLNITRVEIIDDLGNRTAISGEMLQGLGVDTSITIHSTDPDTFAPQLTSLDLPDRVDLTDGNVMAAFSASGTDKNGLASLAIFFDRDLAWRFGSAGIHEFSNVSMSADDWVEGAGSEIRELIQANSSGTVDVEKVWITDEYGNRRVYTNDQLRELGFDTSFQLVGTSASTPVTYVAAMPETITLREGQSANLSLNFVGMTNHWVSYSYYTTTAGGTAHAADIGAISSSGYLSVASTAPTTRQQHFTISASRDGVQEATETAYLVVELNGNMSFPDGGRMQVVEIRIADDNRVSGGAGPDVLYGTSGADSMSGGAGNDTYVVDNAGDRVFEASNAGTDTVKSSVSFALGSNFEKLALTGTGHVNGSGNSLANAISGNAGNNVLNGGAGADSMSGGAGNDSYIVDNAGDRVFEASNSGTDTVKSSISFALGSNLEKLALTGTDHVNGSGNSLANAISGNAGNNVLNGGSGNDVLVGGSGNDRIIGGAGADRLMGDVGADSFVFVALSESTVTSAGRDTITDFSTSQNDLIDLRSIDARTTLAGNQAFSYIGSAAFTGHAGELSARSGSYGTLISGDVNGDRVADFAVLLDDRIALQVDSFLL